MIQNFDLKAFVQVFDHTVLKANATSADVKKICQEARLHGFFSVCINPVFLPLVIKELQGSPVKAITVVGFPLGANATETKIQETKWSIEQGAGEIDMVLNQAYFLDGNETATRHDISAVVRSANKIPVKVIIETANLNNEQIKIATKWCAEEGAAFVKTSTGFGSRGAQESDIILMKETLLEIKKYGTVKIKASGGIKTFEQVSRLLKLGAHRIGSSSSVSILNEWDRHRKKDQ